MRSGRRGLFVDFDGTISEIAPTPNQAAVSTVAAASLRRLTQRLELVCVVSGRAVRDLRDKVSAEGIVYVGNHGAEYLGAEGLRVAPQVARYRGAIKKVFDHLRAQADAPGLIWDDKYHSVSVHYRLARDAGRARRRLAAALDSAPGADGLELFWGKMVLEIRAPGGVDKGYALRKLVEERRLDAAIYLGDDTTDVDALAALRDLRDRGVIGTGVAVVHEDSPDELLGLADYGLDGIRAVETFLRWFERAA